MKQHSISMKVIAVILTVIMIVGILPMTVFAQEFNETQLMKTVEIESDKKEKSPIVGEVTDKRDETQRSLREETVPIRRSLLLSLFIMMTMASGRKSTILLSRQIIRLRTRKTAFRLIFRGWIRFSWLYRFHGKAKLHSMQDGFTEIIRAKRMFEFMIM